MHLGILVVENKQLDRILPDKEVFLFLVYLSIFIISAISPVTWDASIVVHPIASIPILLYNSF